MLKYVYSITRFRPRNHLLLSVKTKNFRLRLGLSYLSITFFMVDSFFEIVNGNFYR